MQKVQDIQVQHIRIDETHKSINMQQILIEDIYTRKDYCDMDTCKEYKLQEGLQQCEDRS